MKGAQLAIGTLIALVIAVIVIALALYYLIFAQPFDPYFLNPDKEKLIKYATCSLALCSNGYSSSQVDNVGCLYSQGGECIETCRDVADRLLTTYQTSEQPDRYCGEENAIEFSISQQSPIVLSSGEIQEASKPSWVCRGVFVSGVRLTLSDEVQSINGACIMFGVLKGSTFWGVGTTEDTNNREGDFCFDGFEKTEFTPIMPYDGFESELEYPSALYLTTNVRDDSECSLSSSTPSKIGSSDGLRMFSSCGIGSSGITMYKVWSNDISKDSNWGKTGNGQNCAAVILDRAYSLFGLGENVISTSKTTLFPSMVEYDGNVYLYFQRSSGLDKDYVPKPLPSTPDEISEGQGISFVESSDGLTFGNQQNLDLPSDQFAQNPRFAQPSVAVVNGHRYIAYITNDGLGSPFTPQEKTFEIHVLDLETGSSDRVTEDNSDQLRPSLVFFEDNPYVFYVKKTKPEIYDIFGKDKYDLYYKKGEISGNDIVWPVGEGKKVPDLLNFAVGSRYSASVAATPDGIMLAYAYSFNDPSGSGETWSIGTSKFDGTSWSNSGIVESRVSNNFPRVLHTEGGTYVFFSRGVGDATSPTGASGKIVYSRYLGGTDWSSPVGVLPSSPSVETTPDAIVFGDRILLAYSEQTGSDLRIRVATSTETVENFEQGRGA